MATIIAPKLTYKDLCEMPGDGKRYELIDGEAYVAPSPNTKHQETVLNIAVAIRALAKSEDLGKIFIAPFDVVFDQSNVTQPDVLFVRKDRLSIITKANVSGAPDLAVEVLSAGNAQYDRETKLQVYARAGIPELWYVDPEAETLEILNLGPQGHFALTQHATKDDNVASEVLPCLVLSLREIFA